MTPKHSRCVSFARCRGGGQLQGVQLCGTSSRSSAEGRGGRQHKKAEKTHQRDKLNASNTHCMYLKVALNRVLK